MVANAIEIYKVEINCDNCNSNYCTWLSLPFDTTCKVCFRVNIQIILDKPINTENYCGLIKIPTTPQEAELAIELGYIGKHTCLKK